MPKSECRNPNEASGRSRKQSAQQRSVSRAARLKPGVSAFGLGILDPVLYRSYRISSGIRHWFRRHFTRAGFAILCALLVSALMGPDTENNVAYQAFTFLLCMLVMSAVFTWPFRLPFSVNRLLPRFGTVGSPMCYTILVRNLTPKPQTGLVLVEDLQDPRPSFREWKAVQLSRRKGLRSFRFSAAQNGNPFRTPTVKETVVPTAMPQEEVGVRCEITPLRRGVLRFKGISLARSDPLGLLRALVRRSLPQATLILPRRYPLPPIAFPGALKNQNGGVAQASHVGQSEEFIALRDYRHGDPLRHIHWRSWARIGRPVVKEFEDEFFVRHALVLDTFIDQPHSEIFEEAVSVAASFACSIQTQESLLDLLFVGSQSYCFTAGRGLAHTDQMLEILASVSPCAEQPFHSLQELVLEHVGLVSGCICVLLAWDEQRRNFVERLKIMGVPLLVLILTDRGQTESFDPGPMRDEPERFKVLQPGRIKEGLATLG